MRLTLLAVVVLVLFASTGWCSFLSSSADNCTVEFPVFCKVNQLPTCTAAATDCDQPLICSSLTAPIPCADRSTCAANFAQCVRVMRTLTNATCAQFTCWDGSCALSKRTCPPLPRCPGLFSARCADGSCRDSPSACNSTVAELMLECGRGDTQELNTTTFNAFCGCPSNRGIRNATSALEWGPCPLVYGCLPDRPVYCADGECGATSADCVGGPAREGSTRVFSTIKCKGDEFLCFGRREKGECATRAKCRESPITESPLRSGFYLSANTTQDAPNLPIVQEIRSARGSYLLARIIWPDWLDQGAISLNVLDAPSDRCLQRVNPQRGNWGTKATIYNNAYSPLFSLTSPELRSAVARFGEELRKPLTKWVIDVEFNVTGRVAKGSKFSKMCLAYFAVPALCDLANQTSLIVRCHDITIKRISRSKAAPTQQLPRSETWVTGTITMDRLGRDNGNINTYAIVQDNLDNDRGRPESGQGFVLWWGVVFLVISLTVICANWERIKSRILSGGGAGGGM